MKTLTKDQFKVLMKDYPNGGIVFIEGENNGENCDLHVTDGAFGARLVIPLEGEVYDYDWNIEEYDKKRLIHGVRQQRHTANDSNAHFGFKDRFGVLQTMDNFMKGVMTGEAFR